MTVLECEKCGQSGANDFTQLGPIYRDGQPVQRFRCNKCGHVKEILAIESGIALSSLIGIAVGKQNSPEKPCKHCGSTTVCDCAIDVLKSPEISTADFVCLNCGYGCYIPWSYCPKCGNKLGEKKPGEKQK